MCRNATLVRHYQCLLQMESGRDMLPLPFRDFISPLVIQRLRTVGFGLVLGLVSAFEVFLEAILEDDEVVRGTSTNILFDYLEEHCISGDKLLLLICQLTWRHYCLTATSDTWPPIWSACNDQDIVKLRCLVGLDGMRDHPAPDGTTGFALSLAQLNTEQTLAILESGIEPREQILFLAQEFTVVQTGNPALQEAVTNYLDGIMEPISVLVHSEDPIDER